MPKSKLLRPTLDGLSQFAHLINVDFYDDLVTALYKVIETQVQVFAIPSFLLAWMDV